MNFSFEFEEFGDLKFSITQKNENSNYLSMFQQSLKYNFTLESYNMSVFEEKDGYDLTCDGLSFKDIKNGNMSGGQNAFGGINNAKEIHKNLTLDKSGQYAGLEGFQGASFNVSFSGIIHNFIQFLSTKR